MSKPTPPSGWHWGIGSRSSDYYTYWLYSNLQYQYRAQMYWDEGEKHTVHFYEETGRREDGGVNVCEYPFEQGSFDTEDKAFEFLLETASSLIDY